MLYHSPTISPVHPRGTMGFHPAKKACAAQHADNLSAISPAACREAPRLSIGSSGDVRESGWKTREITRYNGI